MNFSIKIKISYSSSIDEETLFRLWDFVVGYLYDFEEQSFCV